MRPWWSIAAARAAQDQVSMLVTVCSVQGSAPREVGARMLVWADGQDGSIGGGNLEFVVAGQAQRMLEQNAAARFQSYPLGPLLGQCCGGRVGVLLERIDAASRDWLEQVAAMDAAGRPYAVISTLEKGRLARHVCAMEEIGADRPDFVQDGEALCMVERVAPGPLLLMYGAGHVGQAVAQIVATLPFRLDWFDTRAAFCSPTDGPTPELVDDLVAKAQAAPPGAFHLIFTQSHALDYELTRAILGRGDFGYCGLIGSATKRARFEKRLLDDGLPRGVLSRLVCPIGDIGLTSKVPQVMAVGIAAELLLRREKTAQAMARAGDAQKAGHGR